MIELVDFPEKAGEFGDSVPEKAGDIDGVMVTETETEEVSVGKEETDDVGDIDGVIVGKEENDDVGDIDGVIVGKEENEDVGDIVGVIVTETETEEVPVGREETEDVGDIVGDMVTETETEIEEVPVGREETEDVGDIVGVPDCVTEEEKEGVPVIDRLIVAVKVPETLTLGVNDTVTDVDADLLGETLGVNEGVGEAYVNVHWIPTAPSVGPRSNAIIQYVPADKLLICMRLFLIACVPTVHADAPAQGVFSPWSSLNASNPN